MTSTVFVNGVTLTDEDWFNDLNRLHYTIFGDPANVAAVKTTIFGTPYPVNGSVPMRAAADQSITSNTTLASATNMSFAIAASEEWQADWDFDMGTFVGSTTGVKFALDVPASATMNLIVAIFPQFWDPASCVLVRRTTTDAAALDFTPANLPGTSGSCLVRISAWVLNSTNAGTVQLQIAQSSSSGTAVTIIKGSHGVARRLA